MTENDFAEFKDGKPSMRALSHEHGYPIVSILFAKTSPLNISIYYDFSVKIF